MPMLGTHLDLSWSLAGKRRRYEDENPRDNRLAIDLGTSRHASAELKRRLSA